MKELQMTDFNFDREKLAIYQETLAIVNNHQDYTNKDFLTSAIKLACKRRNALTIIGLFVFKMKVRLKFKTVVIKV